MAKIGDEKLQTLIAISDKTLKATCLGFHVLLLTDNDKSMGKPSGIKIN